MAVITVTLEDQQRLADPQAEASAASEAAPAQPRPRCVGMAKRVRRGHNGRPLGYKGKGQPCQNLGSFEINGQGYCRHCARQYGFTL